jgi:hypothetical protein
MNNKNIERNMGNDAQEALLLQAMEALKAFVPLEYETESVRDFRDQGYDYTFRLMVFGNEARWCAQVKKQLTKASEIMALIQKDKAPYPFLLVTGYVPWEAATRLQKGGIQFIDTAGNAFLNQPPIFILVKGNKPGKEAPAVPAGRLFRGVGLKIAYLLLCQPELADRPYRELAELAGVALGTVNGAMIELIQRGLILDMGKRGKKLLDRKALFDRWVGAYPDYLKPKLLLGRFRGDGDWWKEVKLDPILAQWGGEVAAAKLTGYLKPGTVTLYAAKNRLTDLVIANRLKKDPQGNVDILERFWPGGIDFGGGDTVHPILIYADLAAIGEQRTMEAARMIYEQHLVRHFGQD